MAVKILTLPDWTGIAPDWAKWTAITEDYDGAPDSANRSQIGYGATEEAARTDLTRLLNEDYCCTVCPYERREWEDCALVGGCPLVRQP